MITPAISALSAVEGLKGVGPTLSHLIIPATAAIIVALFASQRLGTARVGRTADAAEYFGLPRDLGGSAPGRGGRDLSPRSRGPPAAGKGRDHASPVPPRETLLDRIPRRHRSSGLSSAAFGWPYRSTLDCSSPVGSFGSIASIASIGSGSCSTGRCLRHARPVAASANSREMLGRVGSPARDRR